MRWLQCQENRAYLFRQLKVHCADVVRVTDVFGLSVELFLAGLHVAVVASLAAAQVELLGGLWKTAEFVQV